MDRTNTTIQKIFNFIEDHLPWKCQSLPGGEGTLVQFTCGDITLHKIYDDLEVVVGDPEGGRVYGYFKESNIAISGQFFVDINKEEIDLDYIVR